MSFQGQLQLVMSVNEFEGESVASPVKKSVPNTIHRVKDKTSTYRPSENCPVYSEEEDDG